MWGRRGIRVGGAPKNTRRFGSQLYTLVFIFFIHSDPRVTRKDTTRPGRVLPRRGVGHHTENRMTHVDGFRFPADGQN
jgi:hypothetical protein